MHGEFIVIWVKGLVSHLHVPVVWIRVLVLLLSSSTFWPLPYDLCLIAQGVLHWQTLGVGILLLELDSFAA